METNLFDFLELFIDILKIDLFDILCICSELDMCQLSMFTTKREGKVNVDYA